MDGCHKMSLQTSTIKPEGEAVPIVSSNFEFKQDAFATKIVLVDRGNCSFVTKVRNAERAGASLVVVVDDREENI
jgi:hypothetical protein